MSIFDDGNGSGLSALSNLSSHTSRDLKSAMLAPVVVLTALRYPVDQLKVHIESALSAGCSCEEIIEVILQVALLWRSGGN